MAQQQAWPGERRPRVAIIGGGLAGMAAAVQLVEAGAHVTLLEARRTLGGRATSFRDPASDEVVDFCQHVSMGCCANLADFCQRVGAASMFDRVRTLHFFGPDGRRCDFAATPGLPAPLHLGPAFARLRYLSIADRFKIACSLWRLARMHPSACQDLTVLDWLQQQRQSPVAIDYFWGVVLISALGESLEHASLAAARKVMVDGFLAARTAYEILIPRAPLSEVFGTRLEAWLQSRGAILHLNARVREITWQGERTCGVLRADGTTVAADHVVLATTWRMAAELAGDCPSNVARQLAAAQQLSAAPITGVHLWFDRAITPLPHAVLVGTTSQWLFNRGTVAIAPDSPTESHTKPVENTGHYCQVVISASRQLAEISREELLATIQAELANAFPAARQAKLLRARVVTEPHAVFSVRPGCDALRPFQAADGNLALAGDWTQTGWPSTMESAVRSGYLAAQVVLGRCGQPQSLLAADLPRGRLARLLFPG